jgi:hypothetical protein
VVASAPDGARVLTATIAVADAGLRVALWADGVELTAQDVAGTLPYVWAPDGAFLTIGYSRAFPVVDDYEPPAPAPPSLRLVRIWAGPPPPIDMEAEFERLLRHQ